MQVNGTGNKKVLSTPASPEAQSLEPKLKQKLTTAPQIYYKTPAYDTSGSLTVCAAQGYNTLIQGVGVMRKQQKGNLVMGI